MNKNLKQIAVPLVSVLLGLVLGAIIMWAFSYDALWGYELLFKKAFGSIKSWGNISRAMGPLILVALGFSVASRAGFFNVGLPGQAFCRMDHGDLVCPFLPKYASLTDDSDDRFDCGYRRWIYWSDSWFPSCLSRNQ